MSLLQLTNDNFTEEVLKSEVPVLVDFYADWCGPCKMLAPVVDEIASEFEGSLKVVKLNVDDASVAASNYSVMSIPTLILFKDGEVANKIVGFKSKEKILQEFGL